MVYEPVPFEVGGHMRSYFKIYSKLLLELGYTVVGLCSEPEVIKEWLKTESPEFAGRFFGLKPEPAKKSLFRFLSKKTFKFVASWRPVSKALQASEQSFGLKIDRLILTNIIPGWDHLGIFPEVLFKRLIPVPFGAVSFASNELSLMGIEKGKHLLGKEWHKVLGMSSCKSILMLEESHVEPFREAFSNAEVISAPEIFDQCRPDTESELCRRIRTRAKGRKSIAVMGYLFQGKGLNDFLRLAERRQDWFFVVAGEYHSGHGLPKEDACFMKKVDSRPENVLFHLKYIPTDNEFNGVIANSDAIYAAYNSFGRGSNILRKSGWLQKPVIVEKGYIMERITRKYNLGYAIAPHDTDEASRVLDEIGRPDYCLASDHARLMDDYSLGRLKDSLDSFCRAILP